LFAIFLISLCLVLQNIKKPFYHDVLNNLERFSLILSIITLYGGVTLFNCTFILIVIFSAKHNQLDPPDNTFKWIMFFIILIPNLLFMFYWFYHMRIQIIALTLKKFGKGKLYSIVSCSKPEKIQEPTTNSPASIDQFDFPAKKSGKNK
jgi:hypothetical protein